MVLHSFRISRTAPTDGVERPAPWSFFAQVGRDVSMEEYRRVESRFVECLTDLLSEAGIDALQVRSLEVPKGRSCRAAELDFVVGHELPGVIQSLLREDYWCLLEGRDVFVHFGWDLNVYFGSRVDSEKVLQIVGRHSLHASPAESPYRD